VLGVWVRVVCIFGGVRPCGSRRVCGGICRPTMLSTEVARCCGLCSSVLPVHLGGAAYAMWSSVSVEVCHAYIGATQGMLYDASIESVILSSRPTDVSPVGGCYFWLICLIGSTKGIV
jgi:hypothetical protein